MSVERGSLLFQTGRHDAAEQEFRAALVAEPRNALAHAMLSLCLVIRNQYAEATDEARQAIGLRPDWHFGYTALASILRARGRLDEALDTVGQAIRLNPFDPQQHALMAEILLLKRSWPAALQAADAGLAIDPEDARCVNARGIALVNLGRRDEAAQTMGGALHRNPHNAETHANQGWALLHAGDHLQALEHFREALRIDADNQWAKAGIVEALKARNIIYRLMLRYFLFMSRLGRRAQWGIVVGGWVGIQLLQSATASTPEIRPVAMPIICTYAAFVLMTWLAVPLFNLMLRIDRFGRYALSRDQRVASNCIGSLLLAAATLGLVYLVRHDGRYGLAAILTAALSLPTSAVFNCQQGWPRWCMIGYCGLMAAVVSAILAMQFVPAWNTDLRLKDFYSGLINAFIAGIVLSGVVANALGMVRVKR